jgi:hypothetical protein
VVLDVIRDEWVEACGVGGWSVVDKGWWSAVSVNLLGGSVSVRVV